MGGHITGVAIEQFPHDYVGALPMCGVMGDNTLFDYFTNFQLLAQQLSGITVGFPFPADYSTTTVPQIKAALGTPFPTNLNAAGNLLKAATINISGGARPLADYAFHGGDESLQRELPVRAGHRLRCGHGPER